MSVVSGYLYVREGKVSLSKHGWGEQLLTLRPGPERSRLVEESMQLQYAG